MTAIRWGIGHVGNQMVVGGMFNLDLCAFCPPSRAAKLDTPELVERGFCDACRDSLQPDCAWVMKPEPEAKPPEPVDVDPASIPYTPPTPADFAPPDVHEWAAWMPWWVPVDDYDPELIVA